MLEITEISNQKNKTKFNLFVNGQYYASILKETAIANNFFVGKKIDKKELDDILIESQSKQAFNKASDLIATRMHSRQELYLKLLKKEYDRRAINMALDKLESYGYISDKEFAKEFVFVHSKDSRLQLKNKLISKGVSSGIIAEVLDQIDTENDKNTALIAAQKFAKNKDLSQLKLKIYAHLARKGYDYQTINYVIKQMYNADIDYGE